MCWMETRTERGKERRKHACLNLAMTKRQDSVKYRDVRFSFFLFSTLGMYFFYVVFQDLALRKKGPLSVLLAFFLNCINKERDGVTAHDPRTKRSPLNKGGFPLGGILRRSCESGKKTKDA